jgi:hypothetical protein
VRRRQNERVLEDAMRLRTIAAAAASLMLVTSVAWTASQQPPAQPNPPLTRYAGQMTEAHVWIDNRGPEQAIPVDLREVNIDRPLPVRVISDQSSQTGPIQVRAARELWEYRTLTLGANDEVAPQLNTLGGEGWESVGVISPAAARATTILFKRPRAGQ